LQIQWFDSVATIRGHTNRMNTRAVRMAVIEGVKSIPYGREVKIVIDSQYTITVAYSNNLKRKHMDLSHHDRALMTGLKPTFAHVHRQTGHQQHERVDMLALRAGTAGSDAKRCLGKTAGTRVELDYEAKPTQSNSRRKP